ncbi:MAG TPA: alpha/beta hydrolase [Chitinophaga sp.]|uniref:alpha/beta fold hydrolase n=1 Tax=Chitinophaga sp. TaxID=1869181 RepID=UPI002CEBEAAD|nr:alpha/beta hydrolase [Chitinophaga sp.]HVI44222.1 alpha/beta hydrolase [Chitinophaga sp.]
MKKITLFAALIIISVITFAGSSKAAAYPFDVKITGKGKNAIIFIPGFACSGDVWNETRTVYEKNYKCYTLTMAGFAGTPAQPGASFNNWEKGIADYIKEQKIERAILIGHSMGGGLALALAADYPELFSKIVVVDALPCLVAMRNPNFKSKEKNDCSPMVNQFLTVSDAQFLQMQQMSMPGLCADTARVPGIINWTVKSDRKTFAEMYCDFSNTDLREKIANIKCPSLILLEANFAIFKPKIEAQYGNLKGASIQYATKGLHFIMYDDTDWYNQQLATYIKP